jgi:hypothetical protein
MERAATAPEAQLRAPAALAWWGAGTLLALLVLSALAAAESLQDSRAQSQRLEQVQDAMIDLSRLRVACLDVAQLRLHRAENSPPATNTSGASTDEPFGELLERIEAAQRMNGLPGLVTLREGIAGLQKAIAARRAASLPGEREVLESALSGQIDATNTALMAIEDVETDLREVAQAQRTRLRDANERLALDLGGATVFAFALQLVTWELVHRYRLARRRS